METKNQPIPRNWAKKYYTIFTGQAFSIFGSGLVQFALVWYLTQKTGSATVLAMASLAAILPETLLSPLAGALVDRWNRRLVMIVADASVALATVALAVLFATGSIQVWQIYAILVIRSIGGIFHYSAMGASTALLVPSEQLQRVSGINQSLLAAINIIAPPTGALVLGILPIHNELKPDPFAVGSDYVESPGVFLWTVANKLPHLLNVPFCNLLRNRKPHRNLKWNSNLVNIEVGVRRNNRTR